MSERGKKKESIAENFAHAADDGDVYGEAEQGAAFTLSDLRQMQDLVHAQIIPGHEAAEAFEATENKTGTTSLAELDDTVLLGTIIDARKTTYGALSPLDYVSAGYNPSRFSEIYNYMADNGFTPESPVSFLTLDPARHVVAYRDDEGVLRLSVNNPGYKPVMH